METANDANRAFVLKTILNANKDNLLSKYDNIFIDCPPSLSLLTIMALVASDELFGSIANRVFCFRGYYAISKNY